MRLRSFSLVFALGLALAGCGSSVSSPSVAAKSAASGPASVAQPTRITVALSSLSPTNIPSWVGASAGIFRQNGLDVTFKVIPGGSVTTSSLIGGDVQIVMGGGSEALGAAIGGADLVILGISVPTYTFVIEGPASAHTLADLKGKTFGVPAADGTVDVATRVALKSQGIDPNKDVKITALGSVQAVSAALLAGAIDAAAVNVPDNLTAEAKGLHPLFNTATAHLPAASNCIYILRSYAASHNDVLQRYVDSLAEAVARVPADKSLTVAAIKSNLKVDDQAANATYEYYKSGIFPIYPYPKVEYFADVRASLAAKNPKAQNFDINKILDPSYVQNAESRGVGTAKPAA